MLQGAMWDIVNSVANSVTAISTAAGFTAVARQLQITRKTIRITAFEHLYSRMNDIHRLFIEHPYLREYFYNSVAVPSDGESDPRICQAIEMIADFFQQVSLESEHMPPRVANGWKTYMSSVFETSPALREYLIRNQKWYTNDFLLFLCIVPHQQAKATSRRRWKWMRL
jgi:hypothetical protein